MSPRCNTICLLTLCGVLLAAVPALRAEVVEGFTEPYRDIDIAASDMGVIDSVEVKEGQRVTTGQVLARLDDAVLEATLGIAKAAMESRGPIESSIVELKLQDEMVAKLEQLRERHHASEQELERARAQRNIAEARLKTVREQYEVKVLEYERARVQLERRRLTSPIDGIVTRIFKDSGEFVSPNDPVILKVVQLDPLLVVFSVPAKLGRQLKVGHTASVQLVDSKDPVQGEVEFVSPTADPQSNTTRVRVRIPNPEERLPCGSMCRLLLAEASKSQAGTTAHSPRAAE